MPKKKASCWIYYNADGQLYMVRVVVGEDVIEHPVSNSSERLVRKTMQQLYSVTSFTVVTELPDEKPAH